MHRTLPYVAAVLLVAQAAIHVQQYLAAGFRDVPVIGPLFLAQAVLAVIISGVLVVRGGRTAAAAGIALSVGALLALILAKTLGLFGFSSGAWRLLEIVTVVVEVATVGVLIPLAEPRPAAHR